MPKLWTFGDSFTEYYNPKYKWAREYIDWKGYRPKVYGEVIAEELGYELVNKGLGGSSNQTILETICNSINDIQLDDVVIVGWSSPIRFRVVDEYGGWQHMIPHMLLNFKKIGNISAESVLEILENRYHEKYSEEVDNWVKLIDKALIGNKVVHWKYHTDKINVHAISNLEGINKETKGLIDDGHYSENGQLIVAKELIKIINSGNKKKLI
jgi:hypothetical protein